MCPALRADRCCSVLARGVPSCTPLRAPGAELTQSPFRRWRSAADKIVGLDADSFAVSSPNVARRLAKLLRAKTVASTRCSAIGSSGQNWATNLRYVGSSDKKTPHPDPYYAAHFPNRTHPAPVIAVGFQDPTLAAIGTLRRPANGLFQPVCHILFRTPRKLDDSLHAPGAITRPPLRGD
jgi:hypothetical protein